MGRGIVAAGLAAIAALLVDVQGGVLGQTAGWPTFQHDPSRSGVDPNQGAVTTIAAAWTSNLDARVYAQPLVIGTTVYAATENNSVYALDAANNGAQVWHQRLAAPASLSQLPCGNIDPYGITGTPVIDTATNILYVVALQSSPSIHHELYALNAAGGAILYHYPIDAPGSSPPSQGQRGALSLANNRVYVVYSGRAGDCEPYVGRVVSVSAGDSTAASLLSYTPSGTVRAGIWAAPASDGAGNLYISTGNSDASASPDRGESVIKLSPTLQELDFFTAPEWASLNAGDIDIGSIGPMVLQNGWILQSGKNGKGYLIDSARMSSSANHVGGMLFEAQLCPGGEQAIGFGAYLAPSTVFIPCTASLRAVHISTSGAPSFTVTTVRAGYSGVQASSPPILSGGVLWNLDRGSANGEPLLLGFNPNSEAQLFAAPLAASPNEFAAPASGAGFILVPQGESIAAFALLPSTAAPTATPTPMTTPPTATPTSPPPAPSGGGGGRSGGGGGGSRPVSRPPTGGGGGGGGGGGRGASPPSAAQQPVPPTATPTAIPPAPSPSPTAVVQLEEAAPSPTALVGAAGPLLATVDPLTGGGLTTADGALSVQVPPGASAGVLLLALSPVDPLQNAATNLLIGAQFYALSITDDTGTPVVSFDQPIVLVVTPGVGVDPASIGVSAADLSTEELTPQQTTVQEDGAVAAALVGLGPPVILPQPAPLTDVPLE